MTEEDDVDEILMMITFQINKMSNEWKQNLNQWFPSDMLIKKTLLFSIFVIIFL